MPGRIVPASLDGHPRLQICVSHGSGLPCHRSADLFLTQKCCNMMLPRSGSAHSLFDGSGIRDMQKRPPLTVTVTGGRCV